MLIRLDPEILHGGVAHVLLPDAPAGCRWRIEWRLLGTDDWHVVASELDAGEHVVPDTDTPEPQHAIEWRGVAVGPGSRPACTVCGAFGAEPQESSS
jgi:hypothetical protein